MNNQEERGQKQKVIQIGKTFYKLVPYFKIHNSEGLKEALGRFDVCLIAKKEE